MSLQLREAYVNLGIGSDPRPYSKTVFRNLNLKRVGFMRYFFVSLGDQPCVSPIEK